MYILNNPACRCFTAWNLLVAMEMKLLQKFKKGSADCEIQKIFF